MGFLARDVLTLKLGLTLTVFAMCVCAQACAAQPPMPCPVPLPPTPQRPPLPGRPATPHLPNAPSASLTLLVGRYEIGLFATLASRRLQFPHRVVVATWWLGMGAPGWAAAPAVDQAGSTRAGGTAGAARPVGCPPRPAPAGLYTLTRVVQAVILTWLFVVAYSPMGGCGRAGTWWGNLVLCLLISLVQLWTVRAHERRRGWARAKGVWWWPSGATPGRVGGREARVG